MSFPYRHNDVVLARVPSGRIYYVKIQSVSNARKECIAQFDDGSVSPVNWSNIFDGKYYTGNLKYWTFIRLYFNRVDFIMI